MASPDILNNANAVAVVGMAGRFPGARNVEEFWRNLRDGVESISSFTPEELAASGVDPAVLDDPIYVNRSGVLDDGDCFDAAFFGYHPREATLMDPQQRLFLECAWAALEAAGYDPQSYPGLIGVFGGVARNTYFIHNAEVYRDLIDAGALYQAMLSSDKDYVATRVSFKLNLRGPGINVQSACSTSGVAVHLACQSLLSGDCDMALAGGGRIRVPLRAGYHYVEGGIPSPDGYCRAFDEQAQGCVFGSGMAIVVLKRLADAIEDGDHIHAVLRGSAINNDGSAKVGFTAPSVLGQTAVIREALAVAEVDPDDISYVEAHGTATTLGDPIEVAALTKALQGRSEEAGPCWIGSVKSNIGHLDAGAAVAGLIKTVLALEHKQLPASLHYRRPNPQIDFASSPVRVNAELREWRVERGPRRAGVSSFGLGGTNFHGILEESPALPRSSESRPWQLLLLSAKTPAALEDTRRQLAEHLDEHPDLNLADAAYTLQVGRRRFSQRLALVCRDQDEAIARLETGKAPEVVTQACEAEGRPAVFMFTGQGAQHTNMGRGLYEAEGAFRAEVDRCASLLEPHLGLDLRGLLFPAEGHEDWADEQLKQTAITQPGLFTIEYALAALWRSWGIEPNAMIGHSIGEYVAACLSGVFGLEDVLALVAARGRLMGSMPSGSMLAVPLSELELARRLSDDLSLAVINAVNSCVASGPHAAVDELEEQLTHDGIACRRLRTSHAFHSAMMDPILASFREEVKKAEPRAPRLPFISNVSGTWITEAEATDPDYWARQLRSTVRFADGLKTLFERGDSIMLEVGPGRTLTTLARQHPDKGADRAIVQSLRHPNDETPDLAFVLSALGRLWAAGADIDWSRFYAGESRRRVPLPTYPFERTRYWLEPRARTDPSSHEGPKVAAESLLNDVVKVESVAAVGESIAHQSGPMSANGGGRRARIVAAIQELFAELGGLSTRDVAPTSTFLELGFESLIMTQACALMRRRYSIELTLGQLMDQLPSAAALAEYMDERLPAEAFAEPGPTQPAIEVARAPFVSQADTALSREVERLRAEVEHLTQLVREKVSGEEVDAPEAERLEPAVGAPPVSLAPESELEVGSEVIEIPLTDGQQEIWIATEMGDDASCAYNLSNTLRLKGQLDLTVLQQSVQRLIARHEALRATVRPDGERLVIVPELRVDVPLIDLSQLPANQRDERLAELQRFEVETPFNMTSGPLIRPSIIKLADDEHIVFLTVHHIVADGWSCGVILRDLGALYSASKSGKTAELPPPMQLSEYTRWYVEARQGPEEEEAEAYWLSKFSDSVPVLDLPTDRPRPRIRTYNATREELLLDKPLSDDIRRVATDHGVTPFNFMLAGFEALLSRLSGQSDLVIGISAAGQAMVGARGLVGHCVNFLPLRMFADGEMSFAERLRAVRDTVSQGFQQQICSFGTLLQKLAVKRDPGRVPLATVIFNIGYGTAGIEFAGLEVEIGSNPRSFENFEIFANVVDVKGCLEVQWTFNTDLFDPETVRRWLSHYATLLQAAVTEPDKALADLPLLTGPERQEVLVDWNDTVVDYHRDACVNELFERQADRTPEATAVVFEGRELTYRELERRSNQLAHYLRSVGVGPEVLVGICVERSEQMLVGLLGILKAGGAYLPVDPEYPKDRVAFMLEDARVPLLLTEVNLLGRLPDHNAVVCLDGDWPLIAGARVERPPRSAGPENLAYVIYTSGSTGKPKGVQVPHRAVVNFLQSMARKPGLGADDVLLAVTTLSFDIAVLELFLPLIVGARVVVVSRRVASDGRALADALSKSGATVMQATPATWRLLLETGWADSKRLKVLCGGEALPQDLAVELATRAGSVWNMYGPTETTVWSSCWELTNGASPILIGRPIANTRVYILDRRLQPVPVGVSGEVYIGGDGVTRGYLGREELTAKRFVADPYANGAGTRLYRTGDLARYRPDGQIECLGRIDNQVKVRGFRIELGEIETILLEHSGIKQVAVVVREDRPGDQRLVAYLVPDAEEETTPTELRRFLRSALPEHMVPQHFVELEALPLTPSGKVDRRSLPSPLGDVDAREYHQPPRTESEKLVAGVWEEILVVSGVGLHDNFFDLGGHSLLSLRAVSRIESVTGKRLSPRLMVLQTLEQIAAELDPQPV